jgi:hypothetical protein
MSEHNATMVDLDATPAQAAVLAEHIAEWLQGEGIIERNTQRDQLWQPSEWMPGPQWTKAAIDPRDSRHPWHDIRTGSGIATRGVDLLTVRRVYDPGGNFEPPPCPICHTAADTDHYIELIQPWLDGPEPTLPCVQCDSEQRIGDWRWRFALAVGNFAVCFWNWPILHDCFVDEIGQRFSGRWTLILGHY